jgi:hypothetical protein
VNATAIVLKVGGIQQVILQMKVRQAVPGGAAGARDGIRQIAGGAAVLGRVKSSRDSILLNGLRHETAERAADQRIVSLQAVQKEIGGGWLLPVGG